MKENELMKLIEHSLVVCFHFHLNKRWKCFFVKAGSIAGCSVDLILYPIDTIKTRLQEKRNLNKLKLFSSLYSGVGSILIGSGPSSALFFTAYYLTKQNVGLSSQWTIDMISATCGEIVFIFICFDLI